MLRRAFSRRALVPLVLLVLALASLAALPLADRAAVAQQDPDVAAAGPADFWRAVRQGSEGTVAFPDQQLAVLVQSAGEGYRAFRNGPMSNWGVWAMVGIVAILALFFLIRGRIRIEHGASGHRIERFNGIERFAHWLLAVSFIILALTGLNILYGRYVLMPVIGQGAFSTITLWGKYLHNYLAFAFMLALLMTFVLWVRHNIPSRYDWQWIKKGGGLFKKGVHPPARKFNAGQKLIFWLVIVGGVMLSISGIALLFPYQFNMFAPTFAFLNFFGLGLPTDLLPIHEMQLQQLWHGIVALVLIAIVIAHIYIGTIGMEGAFDAMGSGEVDVNWAREHHSVWVEEMERAAEPAGGDD